MGCTSSVPNTLSATANKEDKSIQSEEDVEETFTRQVEAIDTESENRTEIKVLPPSDTTESSELVRNNKSTTSLEPEKDLNTNRHIIENESSDTIEPTEEFKEEINDKMSKLKLEVVGKFFEITQQEKPPDALIDDADETTESTEKENDDSEDKVKTESEVNSEENEANPEEAGEASPSQSQSSRATRWEALADIAAELPPSLTVDPLTGQIYSLSK